MRSISICITFLVCCQSLALGSELTHFENGSKEAIAGLDVPSLTDTVNITVPAECRVLRAVMNVSSVPSDILGAYPEGVSISLNGTDLWKFDGKGYGALGMQDSFLYGAKQWMTHFAAMPVIGTITNEKIVRLPKNAKVQNATLDVSCTGWGLNPIKRYSGEQPQDHFGESVADAGDINKDGYSDILVGAGSAGGTGKVYLFLGGKTMNNTPDVVLTGEAPDDSFGYPSVRGAGDVNGDGYDDVIVGAPRNDAAGANAGRAYIFFGGPVMDPYPDVVLNGTTKGDTFGSSVSGAGDVNGDGFDDVLVDALYNNTGGFSTGRAFLYYGGNNMDNVPDLSFTGSNVFDFGVSLCGGDLNGDGYYDVITTARVIGSGNGSLAVFFGGKSMDNSSDFNITGRDVAGTNMVFARDLNGDGFDDLIGGVPYYNNGVGRVYIYYGGNNPDIIADMVIDGGSPDDYFGASVSSNGDINKDGHDDLVVGAYRYHAGANSTGAIYIFYGGPGMDAFADAIFVGEKDKEMYGFSSAGTGDLNLDGYCGMVAGTRNDLIDTGNYAKVYEWVHGILEPSISVGPASIWNKTSYFEGTDSSDDFSQMLNKYLSTAAVSGNDSFSIPFVDVPLITGSKCNGNMTIEDLRITYLCNMSVPDFTTPLNNYILANKAHQDTNGNLTVPLLINSRTPGKVRLLDLNITIDAPPVLVREIPDFDIYEDTAYHTLADLFDYFRDDWDSGSQLGFDIVSATNGSIVKVAINSGHFLSADALEGPQNDNWTGTVEVVVRATDHLNFTTFSNKFIVTVNNMPDPPVFTSEPSLTAVPGHEYDYKATAVDGDGDRLLYGLAQYIPDATIDSTSGNLSWMPRTSGNTSFSLMVTDGVYAVFQNFSVEVPNVPPVILCSSVPDAWVGVRYEYNIAASDDNLDRLNFSLLNSPEGMGIGRTTGLLTWEPKQAGSFSFAVMVTDGVDTTTYQFNITIRQKPRFTSTPVITALINESYVYNATAVGSPDAMLRYSLRSAPKGMAINAANGRIVWTPPAAGNYPVTLNVTDGKGGEATQDFVIVVSEAVKPVVSITSPPIGKTWSGKVTINGVAKKGSREVSNVQIRFDSKDWMNATGTYNWSSQLDSKSLKDGKHTIQVRAYDGKGYSDILSRDVKVKNEPTVKTPMMTGDLALALLLAAGALMWLRKRF